MLSEGLKDIDGLILPKTKDGCEHVFHQYTVRLRERDKVVDILSAKGIGTGIYYPIPIHMQPTYSNYSTALPECERACKEVVSLPVHPALTSEDLKMVISSVRTALNKGGTNK